MNHLNPELKRLLQRARQAPAMSPDEAPFGFASRVLARAGSGQAGLEAPPWQRVLALSGWASAILIGVCLVWLATQASHRQTAYDFAPAYQALAQNIAP